MRNHKRQRKTILPTKQEIADERAINEAFDAKLKGQVGNPAAFAITAGQYRPGQEISLGENLKAESPIDRILKGIEFRTKGGRQLIVDRLSVEINKAAGDAWRMEYRVREESEKAMYAHIEKIEEALQLEQRRHFEDIQNFSGGGRPSVMGLAGERRG